MDRNRFPTLLSRHGRHQLLQRNLASPGPHRYAPPAEDDEIFGHVHALAGVVGDQEDVDARVPGAGDVVQDQCGGGAALDFLSQVVVDPVEHALTAKGEGAGLHVRLRCILGGKLQEVCGRGERLVELPARSVSPRRSSLESSAGRSADAS
jgi:hypothetical protein